MTQIILNVKHSSVIPLLKKLLGIVDGVTIASQRKVSAENGNLSSEALLERVAGAWADNGKTADEDIENIYRSRQQNITRQNNPL